MVNFLNILSSYIHIGTHQLRCCVKTNTCFVSSDIASDEPMLKKCYQCRENKG